MKIRIEKIKYITVVVMMVLSLGLITSCQKDVLNDETSGLASDECIIHLTVQESVDQEITTRSAAEFQEFYIEDLYLLCFDKTGLFKKGEVKVIKEPIFGLASVNVKVVPEINEKIVVIANSTRFAGANQAAKTKSLNQRMAGTTIDSINVVLSDSWKKFDEADAMDNGALKGKFMPMSAEYEHISANKPTSIDVALIRSFAKVQLSYAISAGNDVTGLFTNSNDINRHSFRVRNYLKKGLNNIYRAPASPISDPTELLDHVGLLNAFEAQSAEADITQHAWGSMPKRLLYLPEYPNSKAAKGAAVESHVWTKDRMCIILKATDQYETKTQYFRLDFCEKAADGTPKFLDVERNKHITFKVTAVKGNGYSTPEEALAAPGSNIEYTVDVTEKNSVVNSNGQYAICMTNDGAIIKGGKGTYNVATVSYQIPEGIDLSSFEARSSVTTNMSPADNAKLLFNGIQITQGMGNPPQIVSGPNMVQLVTNENTTDVNGEVYLSFGNIKDTIVVKYYPYDDKKLEIKSVGLNVSNMIWEKNEAKVTASETMFTVPYRVQKTDARTQGVIAGKFRLGTTTSAPSVSSPIVTHLKVDVLQKGIDGVLITFSTNQDAGRLEFGSLLETASPTKLIEKVLLPGDLPIKVIAQDYIDNGNYYKYAGWSRPTENSATLTLLTNGKGGELSIPYGLNNMGKYTAHYDTPIPARVQLTYHPNGYNASNMPLPTNGDIGEQVQIQAKIPVLATHTFRYWTSNSNGSGPTYSAGEYYTLQATNNVLYAQWKKKTDIRNKSLDVDICALQPGFIVEQQSNILVSYDILNPDDEFQIRIISKANNPITTVSLMNGSSVLQTKSNGGYFKSSNIRIATRIRTLDRW